MLKFFSILITGIATSLFFFPFEFKALPGLNTKMVLAAIGLVILAIRSAKKSSGGIDRNFLSISVFAAIVSLIGIISVTLNSTPDYAYASYIISMWVWLSAAYTVLNLIKQVHGKASILLVTRYLVAICVFQCIMAIIIDNNVAVKTFIDSVVEQGQDFLNSRNVERLYGIGASLDVAGTRFSAVIILLIYCMTSKLNAYDQKFYVLYLLAFFILVVVGNMIARTTIVGFLIALFYLMIYSGIFRLKLNRNTRKLLKHITIGIIIIVPILIVLYNSVPFVKSSLRFAFEGFFNLAETGEWSIASNNTLMRMYVFPDDIKTWIIGDGYFSNPNYSDPYYVGKTTPYGYYMGTDVGYLRFIFYFGVIGLVAFSAFFIRNAVICRRKFPKDSLLFTLFLILNFVIWLKVATDIFLVFALFLALPQEDNEEHEKQLEIGS